MRNGLQAGRNQVIDGFRGISILSVMTYHYLLRWNPVTGIGIDAPDWLAIGKFGVEVFFVISGLVITMTVLRSANAFEFGVRRFARLYPAFIVGSTLAFLLMMFFGPISDPINVSDYLANFTMMAREIGFEYVDGVFWSLAVEIKFYAFVFVSYWLLRERFWIGLCFMAGLGTVVASHSEKIGVWVLLAPFLPLFLIGMAVWLGRYEGRVREGWTVAACASALYIFNARFIQTEHASQLAVHGFIIIVAGGMLLLLLFAPNTPMGPLAWVGRISYSLYLIHQATGVTIIREMKKIGTPDALCIAIAVAACIAIAYAMYRCVELPGSRAVMAVYRWQFPSHSTADQPA